MPGLREVKTMYVACLTALLLVGTGCGKSPDELYEEGRKLIQSEETLGQGIETLLKFESKHPDDPRTAEVILAVATAYQSRKEFDDAVKAYTRLIENYPASNEACKALFLLGYMYYDDMGDTEHARETLGRFIKTYPDSELSVSAKVLIENIDIPVDEWPVVKELESQRTAPESE